MDGAGAALDASDPLEVGFLNKVANETVRQDLDRWRIIARVFLEEYGKALKKR